MHPKLIRCRSLARRLGVIGLVHRVFPARSYEGRFHSALTKAVRPGDVVWDIGANVGLYTELFCQWVGQTGMVVAFEPGLEACAAIKARLPNSPLLTIENVALSDTNTTGQFVVNEESSVDSHIATGAASDAGAKTIQVAISRAETVAKRLGHIPNVVKVDVEGFEEEVLRGFGHLLLEPELRGLYVEVHFTKLEQRGEADAPSRIEKMLKASSFYTKWVDASHLVATRNPSGHGG